MYIPASFKITDESEKIAFMQKYSFAAIITTRDGVPIATHLPFHIDISSGVLKLRSHFAAINEQTQLIEANTSLIIFSEPHAYISPTNYDKHESVPTWDYVSVHAYGKAKIIHGEVAKYEVLEQMISTYEPSYMAQWQSLSEKFKRNMSKGITAFEIEVSELQGQKKVSQNKTDQERQRIVAQLKNSSIPADQELAQYIPLQK